MTADTAQQPVFLDTSALLRRYIADRDRALVLDSMATSSAWVASALTRTELQLAVFQTMPTPNARQRVQTTIRDDWDAIWEIPLDNRCLARASEIGARYGLATVDALQLAAADRLPRPARFATFERQQIPAAADLGFHVISPYDTAGAL